MSLLLALACAPRLYSEGDQEPWSAPENRWPTIEQDPVLTGEGFQVGEVIPELRGPDQFGDEVSLWQFHGQLMVLDISAMWCGPCQALAEHVGESQERFADDGVVFVTVLPQDKVGGSVDVSELQQWAELGGENAPIVADQDGWSTKAVPDNSFPLILLVDREMRVHTRGLQTAHLEIEEAVSEFLAAESVD